MVHDPTFTFKANGLTFVFTDGRLTLDGTPITNREFSQFLFGQRDLENTITSFVVETSGASGLDSNGADFDILREALAATGLTGALADRDAELTAFAPTDAAFVRLARDLGADVEDGDEAGALAGILDALTALGGSEEAGLSLLADVLLYHVAAGERSLGQLQRANGIETLQGGSLSVEGRTVIDAEPDLPDPEIVAANVRLLNGTVQAIDRVLLPLDLPGNEPTPPSILEIAAGNPDFSILVAALEATGLTGAVAGLEDATVFAPTNAAFAALAGDLGFEGDGTDADAVFGFLVEALGTLGDPVALLTDVLLYHVSPGAKGASDLGTVETLLGESFRASGTELVDAEPDVANPEIVAADVEASNGTVQVIDRVLLPLDIPGNATDDVIFGTRGGDLLEGGGGDDLLHGGRGRDVIEAGEGDDIAKGGSNSDLIRGGEGDDVLLGQNGHDRLRGDAGEDRLLGGNGSDDLRGGAGDDLLAGGRGHDTLVGGSGDDRLIGGFGRDSFVFTAIRGDDVVRDFRKSDEIVLSAAEFADFDAVLDAAEADGRDTVIEADRGSITLEGYGIDRLEADDFVFV